MRKWLIVFILLPVFVSCGQRPEHHYFTDFQKGVSFAKANDRKVLLAFDSWNNPTGSTLDLFDDIRAIECHDDYVFILLMVDDRTILSGDSTKGNYNCDVQLSMGLKNQPCYVKLDANLVMLGQPVGYIHREAFVAFLCND